MKLNIKNIDMDEMIRPVDNFEIVGYKDEELNKKIKINLTKDDIIEIISKTEHDFVGYIKTKKLYIVFSKYLDDFEDVN